MLCLSRAAIRTSQSASGDGIRAGFSTGPAIVFARSEVFEKSRFLFSIVVKFLKTPVRSLPAARTEFFVVAKEILSGI